MSYTILYNTQFVKSTAGISPAILVGDNNVTERHWSGSRFTERRDRSWNLFGNMLGVSGEQVIAKANSYTGGPYEEHWKKNGKWVDDAALMRWAKTNVANAATVEEIIAANPYCRIECKLIIWGGVDGHTRREEMHRNVNTTEDLDVWIVDVRLRTREVMDAEPKAYIYPVIWFSDENLVHPKHQGKKPENVVIKKGSLYVYDLRDHENGTYGVCYTKKAADALEMPYEEGVKAIKKYAPILSTARLVNAKVKLNNPTTAIRLSTGAYVTSFSGHRIRSSYSKSIAKLYMSKKAAEKALERMKPILDYNQKTGEVVSILETS